MPIPEAEEGAAGMKRTDITPSSERRFWAKVDRRGPDECWPWTAHKIRNGYGHFLLGGKNRIAHRVALILSGQEIPFAGAMALHSCNNRACCNPAPLRWGTRQDNMIDRARAMTDPIQKLTEDAVRAIRTSKATDAQMARDLNVTRGAVRQARIGRTWAWVDV
jgi:hypothetical protein